VHEAHAAHDDGDDEEDAQSEAKPDAADTREVTMALITYKTPLAAMSFPRYVNTATEMQAASPAVEISRLLNMLGLGTDVLRAFAAVLLLTAALSVFIALWSAVRERRGDLALLRMLAPAGPNCRSTVVRGGLVGPAGRICGTVAGTGFRRLAGLGPAIG